MNLDLIKILKLLDKNKTSKLTINELNSETIYEDKLITALLLLPILNNDIDEKLKLDIEYVDRNKVFKAFEFIKRNEENKISYIGITGKKSNEAYLLLKNKLCGKSYEINEKDVIRTRGIICVPIKEASVTHDDLISLSSFGVTIFDFEVEYSKIFIDGHEIKHSNYGLMPLIEFVNFFGYLLEEYLLGELIYFASKRGLIYKNLLLNNLNSNFVLSLVDWFEKLNLGYFDILKDFDEPNEFQILIDILGTINFEKIKDHKYSFVRNYLFDNFKNA